MTRASGLRRAPLLLLAAALVALAAFVVDEAPPASANHERDVWSATLTVRTLATGIGCVGEGNSAPINWCSTSSTLTSDDFQGRTKVNEVALFDNGNLSLRVFPGVPFTAGFKADAVLHVDGREFRFADARVTDRNVAVWRNSGLSWTAGQRVELKVTAEVWSTTLTVKTLAAGAGNYDTGLGCGQFHTVPTNQCSNSLTDNLFFYDDEGFRIYQILVTTDGNLQLGFSTTISDAMKAGLTLHLGTSSFRLADATVSSTAATWSSPGLSWSAGDAVSVELTPARAVPEVELSTERLDITSEGGSATFDVSLYRDPGAETTVSLVKTQYFQSEAGEPGHRWNLNAATVSPQTLTFTTGASGTWSTAQTVTVSAEGDQDELPEQLLILVLVQTAAADGDTAAVYEPVGGISNAALGVHVTIADGDPSGWPSDVDQSLLPRNLAALPGRYNKLGTYENSPLDLDWKFDLSWDAPSSTSATVQGYDLRYREVTDRGLPFGRVDVGTARNFLLRKVSGGATYEFQLRARTSEGDSAWVTLKRAARDAVNRVSNLRVNPAAGELQLSWNPPRGAASGYDVHYTSSGHHGTGSGKMNDPLPSGDPSSSWVDAGHSGQATSFTISGLQPRQHWVRVRVQSPPGDAPWWIGSATPLAISGASGEISIIPESGDSQPLQVNSEYGALIAQMREWRNDPQWVSYKSHTDRWDRALLAFGETVADTSLTPMTADEAQAFADKGWERWVNVALALEQIEGFKAILELVGNRGGAPLNEGPPNNAEPGNAEPGNGPTPEPEPTPPANQAPTVASALSDATITSERGTQQVSLAGVFADADGDSLSVSAQSSNQSVATVSAAADYSSLTLTARARGTATITLTAADGNGGSVSDTFTVAVKAAPVVASALSDLGLTEGATQDVSLSGVFRDADGDALTLTTDTSDEAVANAFAFQETLTIVAVSAGTATITVTAEDADGNTVSDTFELTVRAPEPEPEAPARSDVVARYDADGDGAINVKEYIQALRDRAAGRLTDAEWEQLLNAYLAFAYG